MPIELKFYWAIFYVAYLLEVIKCLNRKYTEINLFFRKGTRPMQKIRLPVEKLSPLLAQK